jgi:hypothetical protein
VDLFTFASWVLVVVAAVTVLWPLNVPLLAVACKLRVAWGKLDYEPGEFWWRCIFGSLGLAAMTLVMLGLAYLIIVGAELPQSRGVVHLVLILIYLPAAVAFLFWVLALEDLVQALSVFLIYLLVPGLPVFLIGWLLGLWRAVAQNAPWLLSPS